jgi:hypothetical protein
VTYLLTYPDGTKQTFMDLADDRGHSLHIFNVAYVPPVGAAHGGASTIVRVAVVATLPDGTTLKPGKTRFVTATPP